MNKIMSFLIAIALCLPLTACRTYEQGMEGAAEQSESIMDGDKSQSLNEQEAASMLDEIQSVPETRVVENEYMWMARYYIPYQLDPKEAERKGLALDNKLTEDYWFAHELYHRGFNILLKGTALQVFDDQLKSGVDGIDPMNISRMINYGTATDVDWQYCVVTNFMNVERLTQEQINTILSYKGQQLDTVPEEVQEIVQATYKQVLKINNKEPDDREYDYLETTGEYPAPNEALVISVCYLLAYTGTLKENPGLVESVSAYLEEHMQELEAELIRELDMPVKVYNILYP